MQTPQLALAFGAGMPYTLPERESAITREVETMAFKISDACISCGACEAECPVGAITQGETQYEIDGEKCIDCGACADVCPVGAPAQA